LGDKLPSPNYCARTRPNCADIPSRAGGQQQQQQAVRRAQMFFIVRFYGCKPIGFNGNNQAEFIFSQNLLPKKHVETRGQTKRCPNIILNKKRNRAFAKQSKPNPQKSSAKIFQRQKPPNADLRRRKSEIVVS
jgi:hypothetical protein